MSYFDICTALNSCYQYFWLILIKKGIDLIEKKSELQLCNELARKVGVVVTDSRSYGLELFTEYICNQGRRQKNFGGGDGATKKIPKNS